MRPFPMPSMGWGSPRAWRSRCIRSIYPGFVVPNRSCGPAVHLSFRPVCLRPLDATRLVRDSPIGLTGDKRLRVEKGQAELDAPLARLHPHSVYRVVGSSDERGGLWRLGGASPKGYCLWDRRYTSCPFCTLPCQCGLLSASLARWLSATG